MAKAYLTPSGWRKTCSACKQEFELSNFFKSKQTPDGLMRPCKSCSKASVKATEEKRRAVGLGRLNADTEAARQERRRARYQQIPDVHRERSRENRKKFSEKTNASSKGSRAKRPEHYRDHARNYYHANKDRIGPRHREASMRRYINQERATPAWADKAAIAAIYETAFRLSVETGTEQQVDHIVPITSKIVCGLHVHYNLQILDKSANVKKGNRVWPGHPDPNKDAFSIDQAQDGVYLPNTRTDAREAVRF